MELVPSSDGEVRKVKVESEGHVSLQAVANLRKVEGDAEISPAAEKIDDPAYSHSGLSDDAVRHVIDETPVEVGVSDEPSAPERSRPKRAAAEQAQQRWLGQFLVTLG